MRFSKELQKEPPKASGQSEIFQGRGGFGELEHFDKHFDKKEHFDKKGYAGENFGVFSPRYSQNYIVNGDFNPKMDTIRAFFCLKSGHFL